jgi:alkylation response protein AidB-like acyl-CoA dehydrogenase
VSKYTATERNGVMETQLHNGSNAAARVMEAARALEPQIRDAADAIEAERHFPPALVRAIKEAGVFRMAVPRAKQATKSLDSKIGGAYARQSTFHNDFSVLARASPGDSTDGG